MKQCTHGVWEDEYCHRCAVRFYANQVEELKKEIKMLREKLKEKSPDFDTSDDRARQERDRKYSW